MKTLTKTIPTVEKKTQKNDKVPIKTVQQGVEMTLLGLAGLVDTKRTAIKCAVAYPVNFLISGLKHKLKTRDKELLKTVLNEAWSSTKMNTILGVTLLNLTEQAPDITSRTLAQVFASLAYRNSDQILKNLAAYGKPMVKEVLAKAGPINLAGCTTMALTSSFMKQMALETGDDVYTKVYGNVINIAIGTTTRLLAMYSQTKDFEYRIQSAQIKAADFSYALHTAPERLSQSLDKALQSTHLQTAQVKAAEWSYAMHTAPEKLTKALNDKTLRQKHLQKAQVEFIERSYQAAEKARPVLSLFD